jgi:quinol monooxygenase YgiN
MPFISVTRLHLRSWRYFTSFLLYTFAAARQVRRAEGFIRGTLAGDPERGNWTITVWRDEAAMRAYRNSGAHLNAMPKLLNWCDEASFAHWADETDSLPSGQLALERMRSTGRVSKVRRPSSRHQRGETAGERAPVTGMSLTPKRPVA